LRQKLSDEVNSIFSTFAHYCVQVSRRTFLESQQGRQQSSTATNSNGFHLYGWDILKDVQSMDQPSFKDLFDSGSATLTYDEQPLDIGISELLHDYVHLIASRYRNSNQYHNFEHAAHVIMSITSFLNRITSMPTPLFMSDEGTDSESRNEHKKTANNVRNIFNDPITSFACVLAGLIHDVDHDGNPKKESLANQLNRQPSQEQNAIEIAWSMLVQPNFMLLRQAIFGIDQPDRNPNDSDLNRFRYIFVHAALATDNDSHNRNGRQYQNKDDQSISLMYDEPEKVVQLTLDSPVDRAVRIIGYMMQISDIGHMIQQWSIYMKWNERLFHEYLNHHTDNVRHTIKRGNSMNTSSHYTKASSATASSQQAHPSTHWYDNESLYMKQYVLPLSEKIRQELDYLSYHGSGNNGSYGNDGAFPALQQIQKNQKSNTEFSLAISNLQNEWTLHGPTIIDDMVSNFMQRQKSSSTSKHTTNSKSKPKISHSTPTAQVARTINATSLLQKSHHFNPYEMSMNSPLTSMNIITSVTDENLTASLELSPERLHSASIVPTQRADRMLPSPRQSPTLLLSAQPGLVVPEESNTMKGDPITIDEVHRPVRRVKSKKGSKHPRQHPQQQQQQQGNSHRHNSLQEQPRSMNKTMSSDSFAFL
jgi:3'5'-cyclic nucleotide phosphodiesterase